MQCTHYRSLTAPPCHAVCYSFAPCLSLFHMSPSGTCQGLCKLGNCLALETPGTANSNQDFRPTLPLLSIAIQWKATVTNDNKDVVAIRICWCVCNQCSAAQHQGNLAPLQPALLACDCHGSSCCYQLNTLQHRVSPEIAAGIRPTHALIITHAPHAPPTGTGFNPSMLSITCMARNARCRQQTNTSQCIAEDGGFNMMHVGYPSALWRTQHTYS